MSASRIKEGIANFAVMWVLCVIAMLKLTLWVGGLVGSILLGIYVDGIGGFAVTFIGITLMLALAATVIE